VLALLERRGRECQVVVGCEMGMDKSECAWDYNGGGGGIWTFVTLHFMTTS
jgi:hypothetical protein